MSDLFSTAAADSEASLPLDRYAERAYLEYAMSVVRGRALPELADGQKPVQRRILFAMKEMGLLAGAKPVKSARVVGEILGKFHPHGDSSAYEALVRMAQDFTLRYPLIDGQGNFGSRDGDDAAAMRYTEARLTPIAALLLSELDQGTVDFIPNYDGAFDEPKLLPARLPMVLLNGATGIAVGMATDIPPHNLQEVAAAAVALLRQPNLSCAELMQYIPGPDFPGGGQIITPAADCLAIYEQGRGSVRVRARWKIETLARNQWRVVVYELPPGCSAKKVLAEIEEGTNPKPRANKKGLSAEQQNLKALWLSQLERARDESDQKQPVRLVFEPKSSRQDPDVFINLLLTHTSLECNVSLNFVMLGMDGRPQQKGLPAILQEWIGFRLATVTRRLQYHLDHTQARIHILQGRMTVFLNLDAVIAVIRDSDTPKTDLMRQFGLSQTQAEDILEIRLRQLARLEHEKLANELQQLSGEAERLTQLLQDERAKQKLVIREIEADAAKYGDPRRTLMQAAEKATLTQQAADEPVTVILSQKGWIRSRAGHGVDVATLSFKDGDTLHSVVETRTVWPLVLLDQYGRCYSLDCATLPGGRGEGVPLSSLIEVQENAEIVAMLAGPAEQRYLVSGSGGYGFIAPLKEMLSRVRAGKAFLTVNEEERALPPVLIPEHAQQVFVLTQQSRALAFALSELKEMNKGRGLQFLSLEEGDSVLSAVAVAGERVVLTIRLRTGREDELSLSLADFAAKRGRRGKPLPKKVQLLRFVL